MEPTTVMSIITDQVASLTSDATGVIAAGIGLSAIFFGAKLIWSKFKGMAK